MSTSSIVLDLLGAAVQLAPDIVEMVTGANRRSIEERIKRARAAIAEPIDPSEDDEARRARLLAIVRGIAALP